MPAGDYLVTLWAEANSTVNGAPGTEIKASQRNTNWRYFEWKLSNVNSIQVWGDNIDEVRLYPIGAQMVTYAYEPLVGATAKVDINNKITYFEYDGFGRLSIVRDFDYNILKKYCYNFHGQPEDCSGILNTTPYWQFSGDTRCKPCPANNIYYTNIQQKKYIDLNPNSPSYNSIQWIDAGVTSVCNPIPDGQTISATCLKNAQNENTGWQEVQTKDMNPCSPTYLVITTGTYWNTNACPLPPGPPDPPTNCNENNCNGEGYKCVNDQCEQGYKVITDCFWISSLGQYECIYHYEFSDGSWSQSYTEYQ